MATTEDYLMAAAFTLIGGFVFFLGFFKWRKLCVIRDIPRSKIRSMAMGVVEIHGHVEANQLIRSPISKTECVYYKWEIKEYRQSSSSGGKGSQRKWEEVGSGERSIPFFAKDETGTALVQPDKAEFVVSHKKAYYQKGKGLIASIKAIPKIIEALKNFDPHDPNSLSFDDADLEPMSAHRGLQSINIGDRKYFEYFIEPGDNLFVMGTAANDPDAPENVVIKRGKNEKTFIISDKGEKTVLQNLKKTVRTCLILGGIFIVAGIVIFLMNLGIIPSG
ncbi:MAG: hypothetical protein KAR42_00085 [candidate division Zixibacteria bacterium]|nr:hypothetical protein [candidate division Zixibacteria bacterium]